MRIRTVAVVVGILVGTIALILLLLPRDGFSARGEPTAAERLLARTARQLAVPRSGRAARNPVPFSPEVWADARAHFADHCATCHGNDGRGATELGRSLYPKAPDMRRPDTQRLTDGEIYWIIENGVRLTGMPAWGDGSADDTDGWKLVHFIRHLDELSDAQLKEMAALNPTSRAELEEERQDRLFLDGQDVDTAPAVPHHQHKEQP
jgi:mono/diheme cytochrome c family protein